MTEETLPARAEPGTALTQPARFKFDADQIATIKRTVAKDCNDSEFQMFMEVVGRYELDPFTKQVYAAKMPARNGQPGGVTIIVARDGLLALADREPSFRGMVGGVVREKDEFKVIFDGEKHDVHHVTSQGDQGKIVGGWAIVRRAGRGSTYFYAPFDSYKTGNKTWQNYPDAMILKVAESMALRKAFPIKLPNGLNVIGEEEFDSVIGGADADAVADVDTLNIDWGPEPVSAALLKALFAQANEVRPNSFGPRKIAFQLAGIDSSKRAEIAAQLTTFVHKHGGTPVTVEDIRERLEAEAKAAEEEAAITDAEVVEDGAEGEEG